MGWPVKVSALDLHHTDALEELLLQNVEVNLFMLGVLDRWSKIVARWYGAWREDRLQAAMLVFPGRLVVPWASDPSSSSALGRHIRDLHPPSMLVGPRVPCDALWHEWAPSVTPDRWFDQRLYVCKDLPDSPPVRGFRRARADEWRVVALNAAKMEIEDLGRDTYAEQPQAFAESIRGRIDRGDTWVIEESGDIVFQINVGTRSVWGAQVGGTYVPPEHRGRRLGAAGTGTLCRSLLRRGARQVTLHVNEENTPAVRTYERVGFRRAAAFRLVTV